MLNRIGMLFLALLISLSVLPQSISAASSDDPAKLAETIRSSLVEAQLILTTDSVKAHQIVVQAKTIYDDHFSETIATANPRADKSVNDGFTSVEKAVQKKDRVLFAEARAQIWTGLLASSYTVVEKSLISGDGNKARVWLKLREFRKTTRFSRPNSDATVAVEEFLAGKVSVKDTVNSVRADLWDTYQARLQKTLEELKDHQAKGYITLSAEDAALAEGYFFILSDAFIKQKGTDEHHNIQQAFTELRQAVHSEQNAEQLVIKVEKMLQGFRAAPLSKDEKVRRAGQLQRFLSLVPIEYGRGVQNGEVKKDIEIIEAITFLDGAAAAFADLENEFLARDSKKTEQITQLLEKLKGQLADASSQTNVEKPDTIESEIKKIHTLVEQVVPAEWLKRSTSGDFDAVATALDQMERAVAQGQYEIAESARLEAYAIMDTGPEAKLIAFAPQFIPELENLFWYGQGDFKGLAKLIKNKASVSEIKQTREQLDSVLEESQEALGGTNSPGAVITNSAIIVFREGLEAVLIIAALLAGFQRQEYRHLRRPLWWGVAASLVATIATWFLARGILMSLAQYGERVEAVVSLIAVILLLLITNWFYHKSYWTDWLKGFQTKKWSIAGTNVGQWIGMAMLGFDSIYREGFETVLFLQALVLDAGPESVLGGVALGSAGVILVGVALFKIQVKLPYKKMLIVTGVMIVSVLATMVGSTVHAFQVVGWLFIHPIRGLDLPYWTGLWFGLFPTWEGICLQIGSVIFVLGSYFLATWLNRRKKETKKMKNVKPVEA